MGIGLSLSGRNEEYNVQKDAWLLWYFCVNQLALLLLSQSATTETKRGFSGDIYAFLCSAVIWICSVNKGHCPIWQLENPSMEMLSSCLKASFGAPVCGPPVNITLQGLSLNAKSSFLNPREITTFRLMSFFHFFRGIWRSVQWAPKAAV